MKKIRKPAGSKPKIGGGGVSSPRCDLDPYTPALTRSGRDAKERSETDARRFQFCIR
jgi:hypothetical protein